MNITYLGKSPEVEFDGHTFRPDEPTEYNGRHAAKLEKNRFFEVEQAEGAGSGGKEYPFPTDDKDKLEAWARDNLQLELDKRKGLKTLIAQVDEAVQAKQAEGAGSGE